MKKLRHIFVLLLALVVFVLGAGTGVVHICSAYCKTQVCSSSLHGCTSHGCGSCSHGTSGADDDSFTALSEHCSCLSLSYNIDFYKISQDDNTVEYMPAVIDILDFLSYDIFQYTSDTSYEIAINAPPYEYDGRTVLAMNSILII